MATLQLVALGKKKIDFYTGIAIKSVLLFWPFKLILP